MKKGIRVLVALLAAGSSLIGISAAAASSPQDDVRRENEVQKERRLRARELFEGRDEWTVPPIGQDEHLERLVKLSDEVIQTVKNYPGLDMTMPAFAQQNKPGGVQDSYDYIALFGQESPPSGQPANYYASLTRRRDPNDPSGRSYQDRLKDLILNDPRDRLAPADVMKHALDSAHGNYPLAMLTAHNYLKEVAYVGREEMDSIGKAEKPADRDKWPAAWFGVSPWLGDAARKLRGLRDSRVPDKMGPWYHFFVSFAAEAWGSVEAAEEMTAWEHFLRRWKVFTPDPEKCEVDLIAIYTMKEIRGGGSPAGDGDPAGLQNLPGAPPPAVLGKLRVKAADSLFPDVSMDFMTFRAETVAATGRQVFTFMGGHEVELPAGKYTISLHDSIWHTAREREALVEPGRTTQVDMVLVFVNGFLDVAVTDGKTGQELAGVDVAVSGPISGGPYPSPVSLDFTPGSYRVIVPKSTVNGKLYREREMTAEVVAGRRTPVSVALMPYEGPPAAALIRIAPGALELHPGDREELAAEVEDKDGAKIPVTTVIWTSSAPAVAGVDPAGEVTGVSAGKALITAASGGAKASIVVQVLSWIQLQSCRITNTPQSLPARGGTFLLKGAAYDTDGRPIEAGIRFSWASHNTEVATVDTETGRILTQKPGSFTVSLVAAAGDGTEVSAMEDIVVESAWADVLIDGRVLKPDGSPAAGAMVGSGGGPVVMSDGSGDYTVLAGGGPHKEGGTIPVQASLDGASGRASGRVQDGFVRGVTIVLEPAAPPASVAAAAGNKPKTLTAEERQARLDRIKEWQKALDCLLEGKRKSPDAWLDCNGNYTMRSRDVEIEHFRQLIRDAQLELGLPVTIAAGESGGPTPGSGTTSAGSASPEDPILDFVIFLELFGADIWFTGPAGIETRASRESAPPPGSAVRTGEDSRVTVLINKRTTATVAEGSKVVLPKAGAEGGRKTFGIQSGRVDFSRKEGPPSFDDIVAVTPHGTAAPQGTIYRVEVDETETRVSVFEGVVHVSGRLVYRTYGPGVESGKPSPSKELDVRAGESARMVGFGGGAGSTTAGAVVPQWVRGSEPGSAAGQAPPGFGQPTGPAGGAVPRWAGGGSAARGESPPSADPRPTAAGPLDVPDPWNQPAVQQLMDQWVNMAVPPSNTPGVVMRYNEWAQPLSQAARATANPEHPADWTRYRYLWENRWRYDSTNLCKLGNYIERSLKGESIEDCRTGGGAAAAGGPSAPGKKPDPAERAPQPAQPTPRRALTGSELFGLLGALRAFEELDWINGQPDMQGREVMLFLFPDCPGRDSLPQQAYMCLQQAQNLAAKINSHGSVFILIAGGQCQDGRAAVEAWKTILQGFRFTFPAAIDRNGEALRALLKLAGDLPSTGPGYVGLVISPDGKILRHGTCRTLFEGLVENKKG